MSEYIEKEVHHLYYDYDENCARTSLKCLSHLFAFPVSEDVLSAATGMHGAGYYGAQCGLVEGTLMFIGLYGNKKTSHHLDAGNSVREASVLMTHLISVKA